MSDKSKLRWVKRSQLMEIIYELRQNEQKYQAEINDLRSKLEASENKIKIEDTDSISIVSDKLMFMFDAAQQATAKCMIEVEKIKVKRDKELKVEMNLYARLAAMRKAQLQMPPLEKTKK